jgi:hypothetical protein
MKSPWNTLWIATILFNFVYTENDNLFEKINDKLIQWHAISSANSNWTTVVIK